MLRLLQGMKLEIALIVVAGCLLAWIVYLYTQRNPCSAEASQSKECWEYHQQWWKE